MKIVNQTGVKILEKFPRTFALALLFKKSPLREWGWFDSFREGRAMDAAGRPIPWFSYAAIEFLTPRIPPRARVFIYGAGDGTKWWAEHAAEVHAVEHDRKWYDLLERELPANAHLQYAPRGSSAYVSPPDLTEGRFDIIVIDGRDRVACAEHAARALNDSGIIIWDDTDRHYYRPGLDMLADRGFRKLEFRGFGPVEFVLHETSIFYRDNNCLGI
jgi:hypothetical protein